VLFRSRRDERGDATRDDARLARPRACEHERRAFAMRRGLELRGRQVAKQLGSRVVGTDIVAVVGV
jgi:hypothetical protein